PKFYSRLGKGTVSENKLLCYVTDMAYGPHPIQCISKKSALAVEVDLTWSRGVCLYRAGQASKPSFLQDLAYLSDLYLQADSAINLVTDSSKLDLQSGYKEFPLFRW
ncbi:hypothetical protein Tco_0496237, partial [Tanacetum coccineum]